MKILSSSTGLYWHATILSETRIVIVLRGRLIFKICLVSSIVEQIYFLDLPQGCSQLAYSFASCFVVLGVDLQLASKGIF